MAAATTKHTIVSYTNFLAFHPAKVTVLLAEKKLPHRKVEVNTVGVQGLQPWFIKLNPSGLVPVIELDGKVVVESKVICETLDNLDGAPLGGDQVDRTVVDALVKQIDTFDGNLFAFAHLPANIKATLLNLDEYRKKFATARAKQHPELKEAYDAKIASMGKLLVASDDKAKVEENQKILTDLLDVAEQRLSTTTVAEGAEGPFLAGPAYTVADAMFAPILFRVWNLGCYKEFIEPRASLTAYYKRVRARPSWNVAFGQAASNWGKVSAFVPVLLKMKVANLFRWY